MVDQTKNPHDGRKNYSNRRQNPSLGNRYNFSNLLFERLFPQFLLNSPRLSYLATSEKKTIKDDKAYPVSSARLLHLYHQKNTAK